MNRVSVAHELTRLAKGLVGGDVPEAFKKQWGKKDKGGDAGEKEDKRPDFLKEKEANLHVARELVRLARALAAISPFKGKVPLEEVKRDMEHRSVRALNQALSLGPKAKLVKEDFLVFSEGSSHKFHLFSLYSEDGGTWKAGNAYGRIGGEPKAIMISSGSESSARAAYADKLRAKLNKGYERV